MGLANMLAAMQLGFSAFETSIGGLGGCPFAPGAAGNVATEDFVNMLNGMGISHGVSLEGLYATLDLLERYIDVGISNSHMAQMYRGRKGHSMN
jgi:hydroxymethylglutaryl-CoA lyase